VTEVVTDSWYKPAVVAFHQKGTGKQEIQRFCDKEGESAREESKKFEWHQESMVPIQGREGRNLDENKKRDFGVRGESCTDSDQVYRGIGSFMSSWRGVLGNNTIQVAHLETDAC